MTDAFEELKKDPQIGRAEALRRDGDARSREPAGIRASPG
jgi:hypothetical protein